MDRIKPDMDCLQRIPNPPIHKKFSDPSPETRPNPFLRSSLPLSISSQTDVLRQFYQAGVPQYRTTPPLQNGVRPVI